MIVDLLRNILARLPIQHLSYHPLHENVPSNCVFDSTIQMLGPGEVCGEGFAGESGEAGDLSFGLGVEPVVILFIGELVLKGSSEKRPASLLGESCLSVVPFLGVSPQSHLEFCHGLGLSSPAFQAEREGCLYSPLAGGCVLPVPKCLLEDSGQRLSSHPSSDTARI